MQDFKTSGQTFGPTNNRHERIFANWQPIDARGPEPATRHAADATGPHLGIMDIQRRRIMTMTTKKFFVLAASLVLVVVVVVVVNARADDPAESKTWRADPKLLAELEKRKTSYVYRETEVPEYDLPDPLRLLDGSRARNGEEWERKGRLQTLELFRQHVYGRTPKADAVSSDVVETDARAMEGRATRKRVKVTSTQGEKSFAFEASLLVPNDRKGRVPAFLLINNRPVASADPTRQEKNGFWPAEEIVARGYATAVFRTNDVDPDKKDEASRAQGVRGAFTSPGKPEEDGWATIAAWAWGASRVMDYLQTDPDIDGEKVAVVGHSRGGKTALWAGAEDQRFALVISNDSGCGGAALSRRRFGETVEAINRGFPYWFCGNFKKFNGREDELPIDQHQLIALSAPRAVYVASADADFWADQRGEFLSLVHAGPVYSLYGHGGFTEGEMPSLDTPRAVGRMGYHVRTGVHNLTPYDWQCFMAFADRLWGKS
jgi:hypothetical protein